MKYYLDEKEVTLEELEEIRKNLVQDNYEVLELYKIEPDILHFTITLY